MEKEILATAKAVNDVKKEKPLVGSWTNFVTINLVANIQLAAGGSAAMCFLPDEAKPLASVSKAFYINMGTLQPIAVKALPEAAKAAVELGKPWVLDPVAAGLGETRNAVMLELKQYKPDIIRGNASEIINLANLWNLSTAKGNLQGVDSTDKVKDSAMSALMLAKYTDGIVAVSGEIDLIVSKNKAYKITGGSEMLKSITGAGCSLGGLMAVFVAVTDKMTAALTSSLSYKWASETAYKEGIGTASFQNAFIDNISLMNAEIISEYAKKHLSEVKFDESRI